MRVADPFIYEPPPDKPTEDPGISQEQWDVVQQVLNLSCSDSRFAEKALLAIQRIMVFTPAPPSEPVAP